MSAALTYLERPDAGRLLWSDRERLRCTFPEGG